MSLENRTHARAACSFPGGAEGPRGPVRGTCSNLSVGGLFLEGVQLPVGSMVTVFVDHPTQGRFQALAEVRHHAPDRRGMGVRFTRLEPDQVELLKRLLASLQGFGQR
jgi:hypothetical protein